MGRWAVVVFAATSCAGGDAIEGGSAAACLGGGDWTFEYTLDPASAGMCPELRPEEGPAIASEDYEETCDSHCTCAEEYSGCDYTLSESCTQNGESTDISCALTLGHEEITGTCTILVAAGPIEVACEYSVLGSRL